jgi:hypothetical protein
MTLDLCVWRWDDALLSEAKWVPQVSISHLGYLSF